MRRIAILLFSLFVLVACGTKSSDTSRLTVMLRGLDPGTSIILSDGADYSYAALDTAMVKNGKAVFKLSSDEPLAYRVCIADAKGGTVVAVGPGENVLLTADAELSDSQGGLSLSLNDVVVKGSPTNDALKAAEPDRKKMDLAYEEYHQKHKEVLDRSKECMPRGSEAWIALEQTDEWKALVADEKAFFDMVESTIESAIEDNSDNWMSPYFMLTQLSYLTVEENLPQYEAMSEDVKNSHYGRLVAEKVLPLFGDSAVPDFSFKDRNNGMETSLYNILGMNRYVLVDFWASWCSPCRKEIPNFKSQYEKYHSRGFEIVSVSADSDEAAWIKALDEEKLPWYNDIDGNKGICKLFKVQFYPTVYLLDSDGNVICSNDEARGKALQDKLTELFCE